MKQNLFVVLAAALTAFCLHGITHPAEAQTVADTKTSLPTELTDYTVKMDYIWGISEVRGQSPQVFLDNRIEVLRVGPSEVSRKIMYAEVRFRDGSNSVERVWLTFQRNVDPQKVRWHHIKSSHEVLAPLRDPILEKTRRGTAKPPMILKEVKFS